MIFFRQRSVSRFLCSIHPDLETFIHHWLGNASDYATIPWRQQRRKMFAFVQSLFANLLKHPSFALSLLCSGCIQDILLHYNSQLQFAIAVAISFVSRPGRNEWIEGWQGIIVYHHLPQDKLRQTYPSLHKTQRLQQSNLSIILLNLLCSTSFSFLFRTAVDFPLYVYTSKVLI